MLILEDTRHNKIAPLPNAKDVKIERDLSGNDTLSFSYAMGVDDFYPLIQPQGFVITPDQEYVIKEVNPGEENYCDVVAVVNTEDLKSAYNNAFVRENVQLTEIANNALVGTGWTVDTNVTKLRSLSMTNSTPLDILKKLAETYTCDIYFDAKNKVVRFSEIITNGVSNAYFVDRLNLASLQVQNTSYDFCTRLIPVGKDNLRITDVNAGLEYVENYGYSPQIILAYWQADQYTDAQALKDDAVEKLDLLSKPAVAYKAGVRDLANLMPDSYSFLKYQLGDFIRVVDSEKQIMEIVRIVKTTDYPFDPENNEVELNSRYEQLEDLQIKFAKTADSVDSITTADGAGVDGDKIDSVSGDKVDSIDWTKVKNVQIDTAQIGDLTVTNAKIANATITTAKIADLTVTTAKIADLSVTNAKIVDATITSAKIHDLSADKITAGTIDARFIRVINLNADWINAGTINATLIGAKTITADKLTAHTITSNEIEAGTITAESGIIADAAIGTAQIQDLSVTGAKIATAAIDTVNIKAGAITTALIGTGAVDTAQIADGSITDAKIVGLTASKITAGTLDAGVINVINLNASNITVGTINGQQIAPGAITNINIADGTIEKIKISQAFIDNLNATYASIENLNAANATITSLTSKIASIQTLVSGNITAENMAAGAIQAGDATIANGAISSAQIMSLDVGKLNAGNISTNKFTVTSDSGNLKIQENTLRVWDNSGKERISLGFNSDDYNLLVRGSDGTTVLFGADGVTHEGITDGAIDDSKVADEANINGGKLDIESVFYELNNAPGYGGGGYGGGEYGGTNYALKSNRIFLDDANQMLDVAFNSLETTVSDTSSLVNSQGTSISVMQGQIANKIWNTDINTAINGVNDQITTISNNYSTLNQTVSGISTTVGNIQTSLNNATARITTAESNITQNANNIALKVSQTDYTGNTIASLINQTATTVTIDASKINLNGYVTVSSLQSGGSTIIDGSRIRTGTLDASLATIINLNASNINTGLLQGNLIAANTITGDKLVTDAITSREIASKTITANEIASNTITAAQMKTGTITAASGVIGSIDASVITTGTLDASKINVTNLVAHQLQVTQTNSEVVTIDAQDRAFVDNNIWCRYGQIDKQYYYITSYTDWTTYSDGTQVTLTDSDGWDWIKDTSTTKAFGAGTGKYPFFIFRFDLKSEYERIHGGVLDSTGIQALANAIDNISYKWAAKATDADLNTLSLNMGIWNPNYERNFSGFIIASPDSTTIRTKTVTQDANPQDYEYIKNVLSSDGYIYLYAMCNSEESRIEVNVLQFTVHLKTYSDTIVAYGTTLVDAMPDINGGRIYVYNNSGDKNVTIGSSGFAASNRGGTLILHDNDESHKVEMGISSQYDAGLINVYGASTDYAATLYANNQGNGPTVYLKNGTDYSALTSSDLYVERNQIVSNGHLYHIGRGSAAYTTSVSLDSNDTITITHSLGYYPIVQLDGNTGNNVLTVYHNSTSQITIRNYSSGGNSWSGTVRLY